MHFVDFALVPQESAAVREALELLAALDEALIRPVVLVHVFTPLAFAIKGDANALSILADHLTVLIPWRVLGAFVCMISISPWRECIVVVLRRTLLRLVPWRPVRAGERESSVAHR